MIYRSCLIIILMLATTCSLAKNKDTVQFKHPCKIRGDLLLVSYYQLDLCLKYRAMPPARVKAAREAFTSYYPKLKTIIVKNGRLAQRAWYLGNKGLPYDFSKKEYTQMLKNTCESDVFFLHLVTKNKEWKAALACWR